ncbi:LysR family transcriptional regulator [Massilia horti]|uniref:LysR family transcriptional regulator n=1 Tax=Massilia horti TaxID=2562153 RepID=A0A4Y9SUD0_9BURK|nr:LysR family transcriptional regulator [Massilia horti]TFW28929.1 LysR family transcriptional regulator [Massilia horti]
MNAKKPPVATAHDLDWNLIRAFLAVVDTGSMTAAAALFGASQPTLSRKIDELESCIGAALFERTARGLSLTAAGEALVDPARQMKQGAQALSLTALGQAQQLQGSVRLTTSEMAAAYLLPDILADLRRRHPQIQIELSVSNHLENLLERHADIAIRFTRPTQTGLIARRIGTLEIGAFARTDYIAKFGGMVDQQRLGSYDWIGYDSSDALLRGFREVGVPVERDFFCIRCDNHIAGWQMALAGAGICFAPSIVAARWPEMQMVMPASLVPALPLWLTAHRELRGSRRIKLVFDALANGLAQALGTAPDPVEST